MKVKYKTQADIEQKQQAQKERDAEDEARKIALEELIAERLNQPVVDKVKNDIAQDKVDNARKAVRDEHAKSKQ